jgi:hypothetical protein
LAHVKPLRKLEGLSLYNTNVTDAGLAELKGLKRLQFLQLGLSAPRAKKRVTSEGVEHLQKELPKCKIDFD